MKVIIVLMILFSRLAFAGEIFSDENLSELIETNQMGVIYIWGPNMPLSITGIKETAEVCEELGIQYQGVSDPHAPEKVIEEIALKSEFYFEHSKKLESNDIFNIGGLDHYPSYAFFKDGILLDTIVHGYEDPKSLKEIIKEVLEIE